MAPGATGRRVDAAPSGRRRSRAGDELREPRRRVEAGLRQRERSRAEALLARLRLLVTDREAAHRAGRYQAEWARRGRTLQTPDALVAGTARAHGAVLLTHNVDDFPMGDLRVEHLDEIDA